ncbi:Peptidase M10A and M12B matrixin and adamalysin [Nitrosotalea devaniterrae]|uniref:Peptidase M10A and M12B matrixin and adamalysin n=1 Tax=Nitrosotalea devaniterrae TaxID=1078905 RepID=A0A128A4C0_9ARCH|nr:Peptidase M10A and M12B matrixin and adamalysin [Candidatus Nitrosotalea devanaterra]
MKQELFEDLASQKTLLKEMNSELKKRVSEMEAGTIHLRHDISEKEKIIDDLRADKKVLTGLLKSEPRKNKILRNVTIVAALGLAMFIFISYVPSDLQSFYNSNNGPLKTQYLIQNLKGSTVDTWKPWHLVNNQPLIINIINANAISKEKLDAIKEAILSEESVKIDNSLLEKGPVGTVSVYYKGWQGAVQNMQNDKTKFHVPTKFNIIESPSEEGDITIALSNLENPDGLSGYTKSITDGQETLKSVITIYNVGELSPERLGAVVRHEFGHALGLGHSSDQEDLMHYVIETNFPFVSDCDVNAVKDLYDGKEMTDVACGPQKSL